MEVQIPSVPFLLTFLVAMQAARKSAPTTGGVKKPHRYRPGKLEKACLSQNCTVSLLKHRDRSDGVLSFCEFAYIGLRVAC